MAINFPYRPKNELERHGRGGEPRHGEKELTCPNCHRTLSESILENNYYICSCGYHYRIGARTRIEMIVDPGSFEEMSESIKPNDPISFPGYGEKLEKARRESGEEEAVVTGKATIGGIEVMLFAMDPFFMMGSLGSATGEKITLVFERAMEEHLPVIGWSSSGGARMQEGLLSLMQMAKTSGAVKRHSDERLLYISVLTDPTTGGVSASYAMEGDVILAEPGATIGFAGKRVVEAMTKEKTDRSFQTSRFVFEHGFVDSIVERSDERRILYELLSFHNGR